MQTLPELDCRTSRSWLTPERVALYGGVILLGDLASVISRAWAAYVLHVPGLAAPGWDFAVFWSASYLTIHHGAESAFDPVLIESIVLPLQRIAENAFPTPWVYPPTFLLLVWPFALWPFFVTYPLFVATGLALALFACTRIVGSRQPPAFWIAAAAFPATWIVILTGQNAFLTLGLVGLGLVWLERRPVLAGFCFGLLVVKPQLGIVIPVALLCGRQWRTLAAATVAATGFCVVAGALLGFDTYADFVSVIRLFGPYVVQRAPYWPTGMPTVFGAARHLGLSPGHAYAVHAVAAAIGVSVVVVSWIKQARYALRAAALVTATLLCQPYLLSYDLVWLALPLLFLWKDRMQYGWRRGDVGVLTAAWLSPIAFFLPENWSAGNTVPAVMLALMAVIVREMRASASLSERNSRSVSR